MIGQKGADGPTKYHIADILEFEQGGGFDKIDGKLTSPVIIRWYLTESARYG